MAPWLNPQEIRSILRLHDSFDVEMELGLSIDELIRLRMPQLIEAERLTELTAWLEAGQTPANDTLLPYVDPAKYFLCYSAWADYHLDGDVVYTATGPVQKHHEDSDAISDKRRTEIRIKYERLAQDAEQTLYGLRTPLTCNDPIFPGNQQFGKAVGARSTARQSRWCW